MSRPVFYVDFNEMVDANTVLLSREDVKVDRSGVNVRLHEGMLISVFMDDLDEHGKVDDLVANGVVVRNVNPGWGGSRKVELSD